MVKRLLGRTGLEVSRLGYGAIKLPGVSEEEAVALVNRAIDLGVNFIDTARCYGDSEAKLGRAMAKRRDEVVLASKVIRGSRQEAEEDIATSLKMLQTDWIDLYQIHDVSMRQKYERVTGPGGALEALRAARDKRQVRFIGVSGHNLDVLLEAAETGWFDTIQVAYNLANTAPAERLLPRARELDIGIINMKPLGGGNLPKPVDLAGKDGAEYQVTAAACLRFIMTNPDVTVVIPGMRAMREVEENVSTAERFVPMTAEEARRLTEMASSLGKGFCQACDYCQPCEAEISISGILRTLGFRKRFQGDWDFQYRMRRQYAAFKKTADDCLDCGKCEERCPFKLPIREMLREAKAMLA
jgi:predicted aldo/keto reductase-like oxidoreductase